MVDRIGNNLDYNPYKTANGGRAINIDEKFSLDQTGVDSSESRLQHKEKDENEESHKLDTHNLSEQSIRTSDGVILELSGQADQESVPHYEAQEETKAVSQINWLEKVQEYIQKAGVFLMNLWNVVWNSPSDASKTEEEEVDEVLPGAMPDGTEASVEIVQAGGIDGAELAPEVMGVEEKTGFEHTSMEDFLQGTQAGNLAKSSDLLSFYDKSGKMVDVLDKNRILDGK